MKNFNIIAALLIGLILSFTFGAFLANAAEASPTVVLCTGAAFMVVAMIKKAPEGVLRVDLSTDLTAIEKYIAKQKGDLIRRFFHGLAIANDITLLPNIKDSIVLPRLVVNGKPRPYTGNFKVTANDLKYGDRTLTVGDFQRDIALDPRKYRTTYIGEYGGPGSNAGKALIPFAQFTAETIIGENASVLNNQTAFFGVGKAAFSAFNAESAYAAGNKITFAVDGETHYFEATGTTTAGQSPTTHPAKWKNVDELAIAVGLGTIIKKDRTDSVITNVASTGAITTTDGFDQALSVYRKLPQALRAQAPQQLIYMSHDNADKVADSFKDDIRKYTNEDGAFDTLPRTEGKCKMVRASWMAGSNLMIATTKNNLFMGTDLLSDVSNIDTIKQMYHLQLGLTGLLGFQYGDEAALAVNDQN